MTTDMLISLARLSLSALIIGCVLVGLFRLRNRFDLTLLYVVLGSFQLLQTILAASMFVEIFPGILVSPGSAILFTSTLFAILLVYIREDADEARSIIVAVTATNLILTVILVSLGWYLNSPSTVVYSDATKEFLTVDSRLLLVGTAVLIVDALLVILVYEAVSRIFNRSLYVRIFVAMALVVTADSALFSLGGFSGSPLLGQIFTSGLVGKLLTSIVYAGVLTVYLKNFEHVELTGTRHSESTGGVFASLTYRERYHVLREELTLDPLTGLFNRGFLDDNLSRELQRASRLNSKVSLLMLDLDHFKHVNDTYGHQEGDEILKFLASSLRFSLRHADLPCRYGGEEFAIILPDTDSTQALAIALRVRQDFANKLESDDPRSADYPVTMTIGLSEFPTEAGDGHSLIKLADQRLYAGKSAGRDRVVSTSGMFGD